MSPLTRTTLLALLLALASPAAGQTSPPEPFTGTERAIIAACLRDSLDSPRACIGAVAVTCVRDAVGPDGAGEARQAAEIACAARETAVWRERLDLASRALEARLQPEIRPRVAELQDAWQRYAASRCTFAGELAPTERASLALAGCALRTTALRAIEVERLQRRRSAGEEDVSGFDP